MDLTDKNLTVVSTDGSYFGVDTAYLVDLSSCSDELVESFRDGSDRERAQVTVDRGVKLTDILKADEPSFVSEYLMYEIKGWTYDDERPEFQYLIPMCSGNFWMVDCWIVDIKGNVHPDYKVAGVPVATSRMAAVADSPWTTD